MLLSNVLDDKHNKQKGFTLLEMLITIALAGILATLSIPNVLGLISKSNLDQSLEILQSSLQDGQKQAIRRSLSCTFYMKKIGDNYALYYDTSIDSSVGSKSCLSSASDLGGGLYGVTFSKDIVIANNLDSDKVKFSYQGSPVQLRASPTTGPATIVVYSTETTQRRCIIISPIIGVIRAGTYNRPDDTTTGNPVITGNPENYCTTKL